MNEKLRAHLNKLANRHVVFDDAGDCTINDFAGGNIDDAYELGCEHGETYLARYILEEIEADSGIPAM